LFADDELSEGQRNLPVEAVARVSFGGHQAGILEVRIAGALLPKLASNMLGVEEFPESSVALDAFGETANVICGNVLPLVAGPNAVFDLDAPEVVLGPGLDLHPVDDQAVRVTLGLESGRADLAFVYEQAASS
jgi:CheY-specific phosphatase CheX